MSETEPLYDPNVFTCASEFMEWKEHNCKNCGYRENCDLLSLLSKVNAKPEQSDNPYVWKCSMYKKEGK
jgi:hypothetical protein